MRNIAIYKATLDNEEIDQLKSVLQAKDDLSKVLEFEEKMVKYIEQSMLLQQQLQQLLFI